MDLNPHNSQPLCLSLAPVHLDREMTTAERMEVGGEWGGIELVFVMSTCESELEVGHVELYARLDNIC